MTNPIPAAAIEAGAKARAEGRGTDWENLKHTFPGMAKNIRAETRSALKAAMPHIRKQVMRDIREAVAKNEATPEISQYRDGITDGLMRAHRLVEKGTEQWSTNS